MQRRDLLIGLPSVLMATSLPNLARAAEARRVFKVLRDGKDIGRHSLVARREGGAFEIDINIDIRVKILGITAYRYELANREIWQDGKLVSLVSTTNDDGTKDFANIKRADASLEVDGSRFSGTQPVSAVATSYYTREFIDRRPWISSQTGKPLDIAINPATGTPESWLVSGEIDTQLTYDARGEWIDCAFDAGGEPGQYEIVEDSGAIAALWRGA